MSLSRRIAINTATTWGVSLLSAAVAFGLVPFLILHLGKEGYGIAEVLTTLVGMAVMADLGLRGALGRHLAASFAAHEEQRVNELFSAAMFSFLAISLVIALVCVLGADLIVACFKNLPEKQVSQVVALVRIYTPLQTFLWFLAPAYAAVLEGNHRFDLTNLVHAIEVVTRAVLVVALVLLTDWGVYGWAVGMLTARAISLVALYFLARRHWPTLSASPRFINRATFRELLSLSGLVFLYWSVFRISVMTDQLVISSLLGLAAVALYAPAAMAAWAWNPFVAGLTRQIDPLAAGFHVTGRGAQVSELLVRGTRLGLLMALPFVITLACFAEPVVRLLWLGDGFQVTAQVLVLWLMAELIVYVGGPQWQVLLGMNRIRFVVALEFSLALVNLAASIGLVYWFRQQGWGDASVIGAVLPTIFVRLTTRTILLFHTTSVTETPLAKLLREGYRGPAIVLVILLVVALALRWIVDPQNAWSLLACLAVPPLVWMPACWVFGLDGQDRLRIARLIRDRFAQPAASGG